jgi:hypothetical protein
MAFNVTGAVAMSENDVSDDALFALPILLPRSTEYAKLQVQPEATAGEIRAAGLRHVARLRERGADEAEIAVANSVNLENAENRAQYDARFPPLELLRLEQTWEPFLDNRATGLTALRSAIESFLSEAGGPVHYPMDTTRADFTADFSRTSLLDDPPGQPNS